MPFFWSCGLSAKQVMLRLEASGLDPYAIRGIVISHEHRDHVAGARVLAKRLGVPVLSTESTWAAALKKEPALDQARHRPIEQGREFCLGGITMLGFGISHDAADTMGFVVKNGSAGLGVATDLGVPHQAGGGPPERMPGAYPGSQPRSGAFGRG